MAGCETECCTRPTSPAASGRTGPLSVGQLARTVGVKADTVRFYERTGLLAPPPRTSGEHRRYDSSDVDRLRFVRGAQRLGLRLREIKELLQVRDTGACPCTPARDLLRAHLHDLEAELVRLHALRADLLAMTEALADDGPAPCPDPLPGTWMPEGGEE